MSRFKFSNCRIIQQSLLEDGTYEVVLEVEEDDTFVLVEASKLSLEDKFMQYEPCTTNEILFKKLLAKIIEFGVIRDFYRPRFDPSLSEDGKICFGKGNTPAVGKSYAWWRKAARDFNKRRRSRLGTNSEYIAFMGVLIKTLVDNGMTVQDAWYVVCNNSSSLGHYNNSPDAKHALELTGEREVYGFFDLGNTSKILQESHNICGFWIGGGSYKSSGIADALAEINWHPNEEASCPNSVGWIVLE